MGKKLVIVESPAKAKTISRFLGDDYVVEASIGHIRDLPLNKKGLPEDLRKKWWADFAVDVDNNFEPYYEIPAEKLKQVAKLRKAMADVTTLVLATDEDREGESISWHLLQILKPKKAVEVKRIAFHEITKEAILEALKNPRPLDEKLVEAQETRRILDRLYGYTLSPVLWRMVTKDLSAGRVQSPAVKLIVEREMERRDFVISVYWDLVAQLSTSGKGFEAQLKTLGGKRIATGKDFKPTTGEIDSPDVQLVTAELAQQLEEACKGAKPWTVLSVDKKPGVEKPPMPFRTTTLQQEANRKFGFSADRTMRIAQDLYEGVEVGGELTGLISYMRTDSLTLSEQALNQTRDLIVDRFGKDHLPSKPQRYQSKVANAQEAHEAIRPTDMRRSPDAIRRDLMRLGDGHFKLYDLIWRRTLACQMKPAEVIRTSVEIGVKASGHDLTFGASGKEIKFPGYLLAYVEDFDDPEIELESRERLLPALKEGQAVDLNDVKAAKHETKPPARFTDASLIKRLEELGIGRPSTYASIIRVIEDRGYVRKQNKELIPTFTAFLTMEVLNGHFGEFVDLGFTAHMDEQLDEIANGKSDSRGYLKKFFIGGADHPGLRQAVEDRKRTIPYPVYFLGKEPNSGGDIVVKMGKSAPYIQMGDGEGKSTVTLNDEVAPADLTLNKAMELLQAKKAGPPIVGTDSASGNPVTFHVGRFGAYLEVQGSAEPKRLSLSPDLPVAALTPEIVSRIIVLPRTVGVGEGGLPIVASLGRYGAYIKCGEEARSLSSWEEALSITEESAKQVLSQPKIRARSAAVSTEPIQIFHGIAEGPVRVLSGRFGPYVTDGTTNATLSKGKDPAKLTAEEAKELLDRKREMGPAPKRRFVRGKKTTTARRK